MNKDYSMDELSKLFVQIGKKKHGMDCAYAYAMGSIIGVVDFQIKYNTGRLQQIINERYADAEKELAKLS